MDTEHGLYRSPPAQHDPINSNPQDNSSRPVRPHSARRHKKEKATSTKHPDAELVYDLFFLANLTVFTNVHSVNDTYTLMQYIGFFSLIWLTWYQVGLYDVRFCMDSVVECVARALQLGVTIGFAACGSQVSSGEVFNKYGNLIGGDPYRGLTLILMASRIILVFQYLQTIVLLREHKGTRVPLVVLASIYAFNNSSTPGQYAGFVERINQTSYGISNDSLANARAAANAINAFNDQWIINSAVAYMTNTSDQNVASNATQVLYNMDYITTLNIAGWGRKTLAEAENDINTAEFRLGDWYSDDQREAALHDFWIVFVYTFASIGLVVLICTLMAALGKTKNAFYWIRLAVEAAVGVFLCLFCLLAVGLPSSKDYDRFASSPRGLPMIAASLLAVAILNNTSPIITRSERRGRSGSRSSSSSSDSGGSRHGEDQVNHQPLQNHELRPTDGKHEAADGQVKHEKTSSLPEQHQMV